MDNTIKVLKIETNKKPRQINDRVRNKLQTSCLAVAMRNKALRDVITVKFAYPKDGAGVVHCYVWFTDQQNNGCIRGIGSAGGYGYCKQSAAFADALRDMGVTLSHDVAGRGMGSVHSAMLALLKFEKYDTKPNKCFISTYI